MRWWILTAAVMSVGVNGGLLYYMNRVKMPRSPAPAQQEQTGPFTLDRVTIPAEVLRELPQRTLPNLSKTTAAETVKDLPDIQQIASELRDKAVLMSPSAPKGITMSADPGTIAPVQPGNLIDDSAVDTATLLSKSGPLQSQIKPDADQAVIDAGSLDPAATGKASDMLKSAKPGDGGGVPDGFSSLDVLANSGGPIAGDFKAMLRTDLLFDFGSAQLRPGARDSLMNLGVIITANPKAQFRLIGHTDTIGDEASNQKLSLARAEAVRAWLLNNIRIPGLNITCEGAGEREVLPGVDPRGTAEAQQLNRRVEIHKSGG
jgi:OmpA-OmpF porin, OOP family